MAFLIKGTEMRFIKLLLLFLSIVLFSTCVEEEIFEKEFGDFAFIPAEYSIEIPDRFSDNLIGGIRDMTTDREGNLYIVDHQAVNVKKFDREGRLTKIFGLGEGRGPGEFANPISVAVDSSDNVYVVDMGNNNVNVFSPDNEVINQFSIGFMPARIIVDRDKSIYLNGFPMFYAGELIYKYELDENNRYQITNTFGKRPEAVDENLIERAGNVDVLGLDADGNVYHSLWYPYEIRKYTPDGELLYSYNREVSFFNDPELDSRGIVRFTSGSWGLIPLHEGIVINQYFKINDNSEWTMFYDLIDLKQGEHIGLISEIESDLPLHGRTIAIDREQNIYIGTNYPETGIYKYRLQAK